jgi:hypothetical protein
MWRVLVEGGTAQLPAGKPESLRPEHEQSCGLERKTLRGWNFAPRRHRAFNYYTYYVHITTQLLNPNQ